MKNLVLLFVFLSFSCLVLADWDIGDPYKMHFPQLPDPVGWDVANTSNANRTYLLADDFLCTQSGFITDFHLWGSWKGDTFGIIDHIDIGIWSDDPVGIGGRYQDNQYSMPFEELWYWSVYENEFIIRDYGSGDQGWFDPFEPYNVKPDHQGIFQINIGTQFAIPNPYWQIEGNIYWLSATVWLKDTSPGEYGWKTSIEHYEDDAVYASALIEDPTKPGFLVWNWNELIDPLNGESLDLAFVITPEPATVIALSIGGLFLIRKR